MKRQKETKKNGVLQERTRHSPPRRNWCFPYPLLRPTPIVRGFYLCVLYHPPNQVAGLPAAHLPSAAGSARAHPCCQCDLEVRHRVGSVSAASGKPPRLLKIRGHRGSSIALRPAPPTHPPPPVPWPGAAPSRQRSNGALFCLVTFRFARTPSIGTSRRYSLSRPGAPPHHQPPLPPLRAPALRGETVTVR